MSENAIDRLLLGAYADPESGEPVSVGTRSVVIAETLKGMEAELVVALDLGGELVVVSDDTTHAVLGARVFRALESVARVRSIVLPGRPHADRETAATIKTAAGRCDALIAVGSGTINDLCKYVSALDRKPYAVFGTAPSMNGYTSASAAITIDGHKKSLPAQPPAGLFLDLSILAASPRRMIRSGLGDSLCRSTAQADWLLSHILLGRPYRELPYALLAADEGPLFAESDALMRGDLSVMRRLANTLVLSGLGMTVCGCSDPGSQGEHLISHYADMMGNPAWPQNFHGEQVGVATLTMARLQERMLAAGPPRLQPTAVGRAEVMAHFGDVLGDACWREFEAKRLDRDLADVLTGRIEEDWTAICGRIAAVMRPASELEATLRRAGAPIAPAQVNWPAEFYRQAVSHGREIRNRFTFLDLAAESGVLASALSEL